MYEYHSRLLAIEWTCAFACRLFVLEKQLPSWILACVVIVIIPSALMRLIATFALFSDYYSLVNLFEAISQITATSFWGILIVAITIQPKINVVSPD
jgi:hypothetical protein